MSPGSREAPGPDGRLRDRPGCRRFRVHQPQCLTDDLVALLAEDQVRVVLYPEQVCRAAF